MRCMPFLFFISHSLYLILYILFFIYQHRGIGADALFTTSEAQVLGGGGLDGDVVLVGVHHLCKALFHGWYMGIDFRALGTDGGIDIAKLVAAALNQVHGAVEYKLAIHVKRLVGCVGEVEADIAHICGSEKGIADGVNQYIGIAVP